jgi:nucleotide-binding universal stress UspA family protein
MMPFKSVLVDIDSLAAAHPALERGAELARLAGARLKIVDVLIGREGSGAEIARARRAERLEAIARSVLGGGAEFELLTGQPSMVLVREVVRFNPDILLRAHARDVVAPRGLRSVDLELCRLCPCPFWAVGPTTTTAPKRILAAVRATEDASALDRKIIETASHLARLHGAALIVLHAWTAFGESVLRGRWTAETLAAYVNGAEVTARDGLNALLNSFDEPPDRLRIELQKGPVEDVIPSFVVSEGIDLVVAGTVVRQGIAGLIVGNTAEAFLKSLVCSVVVVKPDDFTVGSGRHAFDESEVQHTPRQKAKRSDAGSGLDLDRGLEHLGAACERGPRSTALLRSRASLYAGVDIRRVSEDALSRHFPGAPTWPGTREQPDPQSEQAQRVGPASDVIPEQPPSDRECGRNGVEPCVSGGTEPAPPPKREATDPCDDHSSAKKTDSRR